MIKTTKLLKKYYNLVSVKKWLIFVEFVTLLIPSILSILTPIYSANLITALTVYDYSLAKHYLWINFIIIISSTLCYLIYHLISNHVEKIMGQNLHGFVYENVKANSNVTAINLSVMNGIQKLIKFNHDLLDKVCFFIKSIILLIIIFYYNYLISIILVAVSLITFIFLNLSDGQIKKNNHIFGKNQNKTIELFNSIKNGNDEEKNFNVEIALKDKYFELVKETNTASRKEKTYHFLNDNIISLILKATVFGLSIYLIGLIKSTEITLSLYLVLTPYLTSSAQNLIEFFEVFAGLGEIDNTILELESLKFQSPINENKKYIFDTFILTFYHATIGDDFTLNFQIPFKSNTLFIGSVDSGKEKIFEVLQKKQPLNSGMIFIDNKNIFEISPEIYSKLISFSKKDARFFNISIFENLHMVCENRKKIFHELKAFGLSDEINKLEYKTNTTINSKISKKLLYFLDILRCYLSQSKIIAIYEYPDNFSFSDLEKLKRIISYISKTKTVIMFSKSDELSSLFEKQVFISNNSILKIT